MTDFKLTNHIAGLLEPDAVKQVNWSPADALQVAQLSCAISLKRIADRICSDDTLIEVVHKLGQVPMNTYGEGLVTGIQNAIARGKNGITTYD